MFSDSIIWYLFLGGGGAGAVTVLALADLLFGRWSKRPERGRLAWTQELSRPFFVRGYLFAGGALVLGILCLLLDLAHPERFLYVLVYPTASVLTFGSYVLSATVACTVALGAVALFGNARTPLPLIRALELAAAVFAALLLVAWFGLGLMNPWVLAVAALVAVGLAMTVHIAMEWERVVICRFGAFNRVAGPGLIFTIPVIEQAACHVDMRTVSTPFGAEKTLTSDLVPVDIDAVLFWMVWDAKAACIEVENYSQAVLYIAQTAMRDAIGRMSVAEVALSREQLDKELKAVIEEETEPWGIAILSVKVRDIVIPAELQEVMSLEAQAEREKNARLVLASAEEDISEMIANASDVYENNDAALKIRTMHLLYESIKKSGGTVVTVPSSLSDGLGSSAEDIAKAVKGK